MNLRYLVLIILLAMSRSLDAAGIQGDLYLLGVGLDQDGSAGGWAQVGPAGEWKATIAGTTFNGQIYTVEDNGGLYATDPSNGQWKQIGKSEFGNTRFIFAADQLYTIETNGCLYRVNPADGTWAQVGPDAGWIDTTVGAVLNNLLYTVETNGGLWETNLQTGGWRQVGKSEFGATKFIFAAGSSLYTIETDGNLYRVNPTDGAWAQIGPSGAWKNTVVGTILNDKLYTTETDGHLYLTNLRTGAWKPVGASEFGATRFMFPVADDLFTIETSGSLYHVSPKSSSTIDAWDWCPQEIEKVFREQGGTFYHAINVEQILGKKATHANVLNGLSWLKEKTTARDMVVIYIGAHGGTDPKEGWGIATADRQMLWGHEIKAALARLPCAALVMIETCGSGGFGQSHPDDPPVPANVTALCACSASQSASNELDIAVAEALYGRADFNHDGVVDVDELVKYIKLRYKEWFPSARATDGSGTPIIVTTKRMPGSQSLTRVSPNLCAVAWQNGYWSALLEQPGPASCGVHLLGWSSKPGDSYFLTNSVDRDSICLPGDGPPIEVNQDGHWMPARIVHRDAGSYDVHFLGQGKDANVPASRVRYPFAGTATP